MIVKETFEFEVTLTNGDTFRVQKTISPKSVYRVIVNLTRKHKAIEVGVV